jgi:hypothetical protein
MIEIVRSTKSKKMLAGVAEGEKVNLIILNLEYLKKSLLSEFQLFVRNFVLYKMIQFLPRFSSCQFGFI